MPEINEFYQPVGDIVPNWKPCEYPSKNKMIGKYCTLELLDINKHAAALFNAISFENKGESWTYLPYGPFYSIDEFQQWLQDTINRPDIILYAIIDKKSNQAIGVCGYLRYVMLLDNEIVGLCGFKLHENNSLELDYFFIRTNFIGKGLGQELWQFACKTAKQLGHSSFVIWSDPQAEAFYKKMGCKKIGMRKSPLEPNREAPMMRYEFRK